MDAATLRVHENKVRPELSPRTGLPCASVLFVSTACSPLPHPRTFQPRRPADSAFRSALSSLELFEIKARLQP